MPSRVLTGFVLCCGLLLAQPSVVARDQRPGNGRELPPAGLIGSHRDTGNRMSAHQAARIAQQQNGGGRILGVDRNDSGYRVKLLKNGDVRIVYVPGS